MFTVKRLLLSLFIIAASLSTAQSFAQDYEYSAERTALLLVDPFNEFLSEGGRLYPISKGTLDAVNAIENMKTAVQAARDSGMQIIYVPHHHTEEGDYTGWKFLNPTQAGTAQGQLFAAGTWNAEYHPELGKQAGDLEAAQHWNASGFANTDLEYLLKTRGIDHVVLAGMRANTCIESTGRYAVELGYHTTLLKDAIGAFNMQEMEAAIDVNFPAFAHGVLTTENFVKGIKE